MITKNGYFVIYNSILLCFLSIIFSFSWLYVFSISFITFSLIESIIFLRAIKSLKYIEIKRIIADKCFRNVPIQVTLEIKSKKEIPYIIIIDEIPSGFFYTEGKVGYKGKLRKGITKLNYVLLPKEIGKHEFQKIKMMIFDPFQLFFSEKEYKCNNIIKCYPIENAQMSSIVKSAIIYSVLGYKSTRRKGEGFEFYSTREYIMGDDLKRIAWYQVAKSPERKLYIIEKEEEGKNIFRIILILNNTMFEGNEGERKIDMLTEALISFSEVALKYNTYIDLVVLYNDELASFTIRKRQELYSLIKYFGEIEGKSVISNLNKLIELLNAHFRDSYILIIGDRGLIKLNTYELFEKCNKLRFNLLLLKSFAKEDIKDKIKSLLSETEDIYLNSIKDKLAKFNLSIKIIYYDELLKEIIKAYNNSIRYNKMVEYEKRKI